MYRTALPTLRTVAYAQRRTFVATRPAFDLKDAAQSLNKKVGEKLASGIETIEETTESAKQASKNVRPLDSSFPCAPADLASLPRAAHW